MVERSSCNRWRFAAGGPKGSDADPGAPSANLLRSSALAGVGDFEPSPLKPWIVGSEVSISGLLRWRETCAAAADGIGQVCSHCLRHSNRWPRFGYAWLRDFRTGR